MGGLVVSALLAWRQPRVDAAVLSGPALVPAANAGLLRLALARLVAQLLPRLRIPTGIDPEHLSRDPEVVREYVRDPRINEPISVRLAAEILRAARLVRTNAAGVTVPVMIVHGEADPLCRVEGSREFYAGLKAEGCELRTYPGLLHEILNEPEQEQILADIHAWLEKRVAVGRPA
jgi:alpha-beta hydrolase superfamily lysophospholipase